MIEIIVPTLKSGLELAFLLAALAAYLTQTGRRGLLQPLRWGVLLGLAASPGLAYAIKFLLRREVVEGAISLLAAALTLGLVVWLGSSLKTARGDATRGSGQASRGLWVLLFGASVALAALTGLNVSGVIATKIFAQATGLLSTDQIARISVLLIGLALAALVWATLRKLVAGVSQRWVGRITMLILLILLVQESTTAVQIMLVQRILPLTDWLFRIIVPLVNNYSAFFYALFAGACALVLLADWEHHRQKRSLEGLNPAQKRKIRATSRRMGALILTVGALLALVIVVDGASAVYANYRPTLPPATPVAAQGDVVTIPVDSVSDGTLHFFSYEAADGTAIRFLVIHKGSGIFGVGLDACEICGVAGFRQEGKNVMCTRCGAAINVGTIGFAGGCNPIPFTHPSEGESHSPIPLSFTMQGESLAIPVDALEARKGIFSQ